MDDTDGVTSLREAIAYANSLPGPSTITFDPAVFGTTPQTITLTHGALTLTDTATTTIAGPGASLLSVSGNGDNRVFDVSGSAALSGLTITEGNADKGAGIRNNRGTLTLSNCTITGNGNFSLSGTLNGGGLYAYEGTTSLTDCIISGNSAVAIGGGLATVGGTIAVVGSAITANSSLLVGGGLSIRAATAALINCTVAGNSSGNGGGLYNSSSAPSLTNVTVSGNSAGTGGGISSSSGSAITLTNTIVAGQKSGGDVQGALDPRSANNLVGDGSGLTGISTGTQGNQVGTAQAPINALLAPLGDYGGPTPTLALLPGSPAIGGGADRGRPGHRRAGAAADRPRRHRRVPEPGLHAHCRRRQHPAVGRGRFDLRRPAGRRRGRRSTRSSRSTAA